MHMMGTFVLDASNASGGYSFERILRLAEERMPDLAPFRRRLAAIPFGFDHPVWIDDPDLRTGATSTGWARPLRDRSNITVVSYLESVDFGVIACERSVPHVGDIALGFGAAVADLHKLALVEKTRRRLPEDRLELGAAQIKELPTPTSTPRDATGFASEASRKDAARVWPSSCR